MSSRDSVLGRVRAALGGETPSVTAIPRNYTRRGTLAPGTPAVVDLLVDRLLDYKAIVHRVGTADLPRALEEALADISSVVIGPDLDPEIADACGNNGRTVTIDSAPTALTAAELDRIDSVVTTARVAIALSGTIILDGGAGQGRRAITLVPDRHAVILSADQIVETVSEAIGVLTPTAPLTMIAGPSATSDIELERVEGVHGPRTLHVIVIE